MKLLLDTHVWLWMGLDRKQIGPKATQMLEDETNELAFSVASVWEIVVKSQLGKLRLPLEPSEYVRTRLRKSKAAVLNILLDHVLALGSLHPLHRDPFDRILIAQAISEGCTLVTADSHVLDYPVHCIDARI